MTQLPGDVEVAKEYVDMYYAKLNDLEEKLEELAIDKKAFRLMFGEIMVLHRLAINSERTWQNATQASLDAARAKAAKKPFWRPAR